ncbi:MAG: CCA tRNA nucleotidyltransferase [Candidatus Izemoplasmatales bacterium]
MDRLFELGSEIIRILAEHEHEAYFVGGSIRDALLGLEIKDIDITTSALPEEVMRIFPMTKPTGIKYQSVTVPWKNHRFEITSFRTEGKYENHRHPTEVRHTTNLKDDLLRRDFTINALAMDAAGTIIDHHEGLSDLNHGIIRSIGDPKRRFEEDALRILRACRFQSKLGFVIEATTAEAMRDSRHLLLKIANERILNEWAKILEGAHCQMAIQTMIDLRMTDVFPELARGMELLRLRSNHSLNTIQFFALCQYLNQEALADSWRFSKKERYMINRLAELVEVTQNDLFDALIVFGYGTAFALMANQINVVINPDNDQRPRIEDIDRHMPIRNTCDLAFKGQDILDTMGLKDVRIIGMIIDEVIKQVITGELNNTYSDIKTFVEAYIHLHGMKDDQ